MTGDTKISELQNELKIKAFEAERTQMVYEETLKTLKQSQLDVDKLQKKMEVSYGWSSFQRVFVKRKKPVTVPIFLSREANNQNYFATLFTTSQFTIW